MKIKYQIPYFTCNFYFYGQIAYKKIFPNCNYVKHL